MTTTTDEPTTERRGRRRLTDAEELEVVNLYTTTETPVAEIKHTYSLTNGGLYSLMRRHNVVTRSATQIGQPKPKKARKRRHVPAEQVSIVLSEELKDPQRHAFTPYPSTPHRCKHCKRAASRHVVPGFSLTRVDAVEPEPAHANGNGSLHVDDARPIVETRQLDVVVAPNGIVEGATTRRLPNPEESEWIVKFTGEVSVRAVSIDQALTEARKLGIVRRIYSARVK